MSRLWLVVYIQHSKNIMYEKRRPSGFNKITAFHLGTKVSRSEHGNFFVNTKPCIFFVLIDTHRPMQNSVQCI